MVIVKNLKNTEKHKRENYNNTKISLPKDNH